MTVTVSSDHNMVVKKRNGWMRVSCTCREWSHRVAVRTPGDCRAVFRRHIEQTFNAFDHQAQALLRKQYSMALRKIAALEYALDDHGVARIMQEHNRGIEDAAKIRLEYLIEYAKEDAQEDEADRLQEILDTIRGLS